MKRIRALSLIMSLIMVLGMLTGCSSEGSGTESSDPRKKYEGTTLNVLLKTGYETSAITEYKEEFEAATGITLNVEIYDEATLRDKFILDCNTQKGYYDVVATQFWYMPQYINSSWLEGLNEYNTNQSDEEWNSLEYISDSALGMFKDSEGELFSTCVSCTGGVLIYRKDLFEKHNIPTPETTEDVLEAAKILKEKEPDVYPFVARGDSTSGSFGTSAGWAWAYGASVLQEDGSVTCNTPEMKAAMSNFVSLMQDYSSEDAAAMGWDTMSELYRQGKAAMNFDMNGFVSTYASEDVSSVVGQIDCTLIKGEDGKTAQWMYGEGLGISSFSENKDAAWLFLQWRNSLEVTKKEVADGTRFDFPDTRIYETEEYKEKTQSIEFFVSKLPEIIDSIDSTYWPSTEKFEKIAEAFQQEISILIAGEKSVEEALNDAQKAVESVVE